MKVIKHGKKEFIGIYSRCGCVFNYTIDDLNARVSITNGEVNCPDCGRKFYHKDQSVKDKLVMHDRPEMTTDWVTTSTDLPMTEIRLPEDTSKRTIEYINDNSASGTASDFGINDQNGTASDAIFWS